MKLSAKDIAKIIDARLYGNALTQITGVSSFDNATSSDITFAGDAAYLSRMDHTHAGAVIVPDGCDFDPGIHPCLLVAKNPRLAFFELVNRFHPAPAPAPGISPLAVIGDNCTMGTDVTVDAHVVIKDNVVIKGGAHIMPHVYIGEGCVVGAHCVIKPNVTLMDRSCLGNHVIIHSGSVIGSDGYGFVQDAGAHVKLSHTGYVKIGDHVEIGACNTIDRGTLGITSIGSGVKTDNQVHIAHNVTIGDNTLVVAQAGIAGSTRVGKNVIIAGKAGISGHLTIGDNAIVGPYAGVSSSVSENEIVSGIPHMPHKTWLKVVNIITRLPGMRKSLLSLEKRLDSLESTINKSEFQ